MKLFKRGLCLLLVLLTVGGLCACGKKGSRDSSYTYSEYVYVPEVSTSSDAINKVKKSSWVESKIAQELGFNNFYSPDYGSATATQNDKGIWKVTLKGKMSGYIDEYHDDYESYKFELTAEVTEYGYVNNVLVKRV